MKRFTPQLLQRRSIWRITLYIFNSVTDYIECRYMGDLNLEALMGDPIAGHIYECFMTEVGELGALLADPRTY